MNTAINRLHIIQIQIDALIAEKAQLKAKYGTWAKDWPQSEIEYSRTLSDEIKALRAQYAQSVADFDSKANAKSIPWG